MAKSLRINRKRDEMATSNLRSWKLYEFTAHESNVNCLALGHMSARVLVTGGYDHKVNLWAIGSSTSILSLNAHASPVECVRFGHTEEFVCSGSQAGELSVWDLEANNKSRTFSGHRDAIRTIDFHPYGDFLCSGSLDTTIKLWDLRRKGCLSSYKGHTLTVNRVRFSPDGIWMASAGEDGLVKLWDVRIGRQLAEFSEHEAAVLSTEFHPHEFLLASGSMDRTVQFWDLEKMKAVSSTQQDSAPIRCLRFSSEGHCLYAGTEDYLKVYLWEPGRLLDSVNTGWGNIQDMVQTPQQLVGASFNKSKVTLMTVDVTALRTRPDPVTASGSSTQFSPRGAKVRKSFSKEKLSPGAFTVKRMEEADRSGGDTEEERSESTPTMPFQPNRTLNRTPPPAPEPIPENVNEDRIIYHRADSPPSEPEPLSLSSLDSNPRGSAYSPPSTYPTPRSPSPKTVTPLKPRRHSTSEQQPKRPVVPDRTKAVQTSRQTNRSTQNDSDDVPYKLNNIRHCPSEPSLVKPSPRPPRKTSLSVQTDNTTPLSSLKQQYASATPAAAATPVARPRPVLPVRPSPAASPAYYTPPQSFSNADCAVDETAERLGGVNIEDFLPKGSGSSYKSDFHSNVSETEAFAKLSSNHNSMMLALGNRQRCLQVVFSVWHTKDARAAIESAIRTSDPGVLADLLGVLVLRPTIWTLDICGSVLPSLENLLSSRYEAYMTIGCSALTVILRNFAHLIKSNILAPVHTMGVDISREERYNKSLRCYQNLLSIRAFLLKRQTLSGKVGQSFREVLLLMENLEN